MGDLGLDALHLLGGLDAGGDVGLPVFLHLQQLVVPLEGSDLRFLHAEFGIQLGDPVVDVFRGLPDDLLFLVDGGLVVHGDHLVQDIGRPLRRRIVQGQVHDAFRGRVPGHIDLVPV